MGFTLILVIELIYSKDYYYQIYQLGTGRHTQKAQAYTRCLPIAKGT